MSNVFQNALANSALVAVLDSSKTGDVFHYKTTATPTIGKFVLVSSLSYLEHTNRKYSHRAHRAGPARRYFG